MSIRKDPESGKWRVNIRPSGVKGPQIKRTFNTKSEALYFEKHTFAEYADKPWQPKKDSRKLSEIIDLWYSTHGKNLKDGFRRRTALVSICEALNDPKGERLDPEAVLRYRSERISKGRTAKTVNNEMTYLNAVFNELIRSKVIHYQNPIAGIRPLKVDETELSYLTTEQISELLAEIKHEDANLISRICLNTGCRWGEAQGLKRRQVRDGHIHFTQTKSSKNRNVPISKDLEAEILSVEKDVLFSWSLSAFRRALARTSIQLPKGQASHVLRHTFASHFMMNGGNILTLQKILGHSSLTMTMRYAHFAPEHLQDAIRLNPLSHNRPT